MAADVHERAQRVVAVARHDDRQAAGVGREEAARAVELAEMAGVLPRARGRSGRARSRRRGVRVPPVRQRAEAGLDWRAGHRCSLTDLAMGMQATTPFWLDAPYEPRPPLAGDEEVDVCVIGGGVGGLSCARRLADHGLRTLLLEGRTVASGASGRNGGFLLAGRVGVPRRRAREVRARGGEAPLRAHARRAGGVLRARRGARGGRGRAPRRLPAHGGVRGGGDPRPAPRRGAARGRLPGRDRRGRRPPAGPAAASGASRA